MFHDFFTLSGLFRIVNFGAFFALIAFFFKRNFIPTIKKQIQDKKLLIHNLEQQKQGIKNQLNNLNQAVEQQHHIAQALHKKIVQWNTFVDQEHEREKKEKAHMRAMIEQKIELKNQEIAFFSLYTTALAHSIKKTEHTLAAYFEKNGHGKKYCDDVVQSIEESAS